MKVERFIAAVFAIIVHAQAHAEIDWSDVPDLSDRDKADIAALAQAWYLDGATKASVQHHFPSAERSIAIRSDVYANGLRRSWREIYVCRSNEGYCRGAERPGIGDWRLGKEPVQQERWRISDGDWFVDVELGSGISYAEAESIVLAIRRRQLTTTPELKDYTSFDTSNITSIRTSDPIAREFQVSIGTGGSGQELSIRLKDGEVLLYELAIWRA